MALAAAAARAPVASAAPPSISAPSAILVEPETGDIVYARHATQRRPMASTTKLMTALLALERRKLSDTMTVAPYAAGPAESVAGLTRGERMTTADLLRALFLASANDAAATIAADVGGSQRGFVRLMNQRARRAGLTGTHYANAVGLDSPGNYSTATDLAKLALLVRRNAFARQVMDRRSAVLQSGDHPRVVENRNTLVGAVPWMDGVKTGHTSTAGYLLVGSGSRGGVPLVSVVMGAGSEGARDADTLALMRYGFSRYHRVTPVTAGRPVGELAVRDQDAKVAVVPARSVRIVSRRGERVTTITRDLPADVVGPVPKGTRVGEVLIRRRGATVATVPLVTATAVDQATLLQRESWLLPVGVALVLAAIVCGVLATAGAANRRRRRRRGGARSEPA